MTSIQSHKLFLATAPKWVVENDFDPISSGPCVQPGTKFKVLIAYFVEINQQSDSFPLLTIIKTNKTKTLFSVFSIEYIFLPQGD